MPLTTARLLTALSLVPILSATVAAAAAPWRPDFASSPVPSPQCASAAGKPVLRVTGRHFTDPAGRVVILRGANVSGGAKVPPFIAVPSASDLDWLPGLGLNVIRLVFIWEAYEPTPGGYDEAYLARMHAVAAAACERGLYVIVDIHQDGFARGLARGSGDGFPAWAVSRRASPTRPDNSPACKNWPILMATDPGIHRSFADFYGDVAGVRTRYLHMLQRVAAGFADIPGVIGYDPINEPWGNERRDLGPLYRDAAVAIRTVDPTAILFLEGHVTTNTGLQTRLDRPAIDNVAYAPHYYRPATIARNGWSGLNMAIELAFARMETKAAAWGVPLFLGEFGAPAEARSARAYVSYLYDRLDRGLISGAQWNYAPTWNPRDRDGWNGEDFNFLAPSGATRANFPERPHPLAVAGVPLGFSFGPSTPPAGGPALDFLWDHHPERGTTEIHVPGALFPPSSLLTLEGPGLTAHRDLSRQLLILASPQPGVHRARLAAGRARREPL